MFARILKFWFTGKDNESYEIMRALTALSVVVMLGYIGWHLIVNKQFDPLAAAGGLGALLFGGGAGSAIKDGTIGGGKQTKVAGDLNTENIENVEMQPKP
jgi:hypothetical protein